MSYRNWIQTALAFGRRGDTVYATMRDPAVDRRLQQVADQEKLPVLVRPLDVTDGDAICQIVGDIVREQGVWMSS